MKLTILIVLIYCLSSLLEARRIHKARKDKRPLLANKAPIKDQIENFYLAFFKSLRLINKEKLKALDKLTELGLLPENISSTIEYIKQLPISQIYPFPEYSKINNKTISDAIEVVKTLRQNEIVLITNLKFVRERINVLLDALYSLNSLSEEHYDIITRRFGVKVSNKFELLKKIRKLFSSKFEKKKIFELIPKNVVKTLEVLEQVNQAEINQMIKDLRLQELLDDRNKLKDKLSTVKDLKQTTGSYTQNASSLSSQLNEANNSDVSTSTAIFVNESTETVSETSSSTLSNIQVETVSQIDSTPSTLSSDFLSTAISTDSTTTSQLTSEINLDKSAEKFISAEPTAEVSSSTALTAAESSTLSLDFSTDSTSVTQPTSEKPTTSIPSESTTSAPTAEVFSYTAITPTESTTSETSSTLSLDFSIDSTSVTRPASEADINITQDESSTSAPTAEVFSSTTSESISSGTTISEVEAITTSETSTESTTLVFNNVADDVFVTQKSNPIEQPIPAISPETIQVLHTTTEIANQPIENTTQTDFSETTKTFSNEISSSSILEISSEPVQEVSTTQSSSTENLSTTSDDSSTSVYVIDSTEPTTIGKIVSTEAVESAPPAIQPVAESLDASIQTASSEPVNLVLSDKTTKNETIIASDKLEKNVESIQKNDSIGETRKRREVSEDISSLYKPRVKIAPGFQASGHLPFRASNPEAYLSAIQSSPNSNKPPVTFVESNSKTDSKVYNGCYMTTIITTTVTRTYSQISPNEVCIVPENVKNNKS